MKVIHAYLNFDGNCREAMTFYEECLGAKLETMTFAQANFPCPDSAKERLIHARIVKGSALLMASDTMPDMPFEPGNNFSISVSCNDVKEIEKIFSALSRGGEVTMPLEETFFAQKFGMLIDKFGILSKIYLVK